MEDQIRRELFFFTLLRRIKKVTISAKEEAALGLVAKTFVSATDKQANDLLTEGIIWEVQHE